MPGSLAHRLSASDAGFLYLERPNAPLHIGSLGIYQGQIPYEPFVSHIQSRLPNIPRYRQRVAFVPFGLAHPTWEDDPNFDIHQQIKFATLPPPGNQDQLRQLTAKIFEEPLDRSRPLWEMYVIHGIEGDKSGILSKVHHCMVDGVSGIELLMAVVDISPEPAPPPPDDMWEPKPLPATANQLADAFWDGMSQQMELWQEVQESVLDPVSRWRRTQDITRSLTTASPWLLRPAPRMPFSTRLTKDRRVAFCDVSFVEIREIRSALGGTVNDVVIAVLAGALRRYLSRHGYDVDGGQEPRVAIPVNIRVEDEEGTLGNRISGMLSPMPIGEADPAKRLEAVRDRLDGLKREHQPVAIEQLSRLATYTPAPMLALAEAMPVANTLVNMICTNVPGPMIPLYCIGHLLLDHYPYVPLSLDMGLGVGVTSYNHRLFFGLMCDPNAVPDLDSLKQDVDVSYLELRNAAGVGPSDVPSINGRSSNGATVARAEPAPAPERAN